ncbi:hypothetical protein ABPG77_001467 [Micractinium sp. CCAP 211/92]
MPGTGSLAALVLAATIASAAAARPSQRQLQGAASTPSTPFSNVKSKEEAFAALSNLLPSGVQAAVAGTAMPLDESKLHKLYAEWKVHFEQSYPSDSEDAKRYGIFAENVRRIIANNAPGSRFGNWEVLNPFTAMTPAEFRARFTTNLRKPELKASGVQRPRSSSVAAVQAAAAVDWRATGKVTPIKQQGKCGSCWAFSELAAIESKVLITTQTTAADSPIDLAEQQILDCGSPGEDGCNGGRLHQAYAYVASAFATSEARYPYYSGATDHDGACNITRLSSIPDSAKVSLAAPGYVFLQQWSAAALREAVAVQPVTVGIWADDDFQRYGGGVWEASHCPLPSGPPSLLSAKMNHAVLIIGYNMTANPPYWLLKNSWGTDWGEDGFFRLEMLDDNTYGTCSMYAVMTMPTDVILHTDLPSQTVGVSVRLVNGSDAHSGRVEVYHGGVWGTACSRGFNATAATVVCKQLGLGPYGTVLGGARFGPGSGPVLLDEVRCTGAEASLLDCAFKGWGNSTCSHSQDVGVSCSSTPPNPVPAVKVRLVSGTKTNARAGRVEVWHNGRWGTVCSDFFGPQEARVVCRQLGYNTAGRVWPSTRFGRGTGTIWLDDLACTGSEARLESCCSRGWGIHNCQHSKDVGVSC